MRGAILSQFVILCTQNQSKIWLSTQVLGSFSQNLNAEITGVFNSGIFPVRDLRLKGRLVLLGSL